MKDDSDKNADARGYPRRAGYRSPRPPKIRSAALKPPPVPEPAGAADFEEFAAEDGLRMLAALETLPSLEPDFGDDLSAEAAVTIVETGPTTTLGGAGRTGPSAPRSLRDRLGEVSSRSGVGPDSEAAVPGPVEEAVVEIVELPTEPRVARDSDNPPTRRARWRPRR